MIACKVQKRWEAYPITHCLVFDALPPIDSVFDYGPAFYRVDAIYWEEGRAPNFEGIYKSCKVPTILVVEIDKNEFFNPGPKKLGGSKIRKE